MKNQKTRTMQTIVTLTVVLSLAGLPTFSAATTTLTPALAAKKEMVRNQRDQRITDEKRKAAAAALKAERIKVHRARLETQQVAPSATASDKK